jgi:hypothetical protein
MTFEDDFIRIAGMNVCCKKIDLEFPPPEELEWGGRTFKRIRYSQITDEQRETMTHVARGAEYEMVEEV